MANVKCCKCFSVCFHECLCVGVCRGGRGSVAVGVGVCGGGVRGEADLDVSVGVGVCIIESALEGGGERRKIKKKIYNRRIKIREGFCSFHLM